jgi:hypothetical protein
MKKTFLIVSVILGLALCPLSADDYVDDAYYWDGQMPVARSSAESASKDVVTTTVKKVPTVSQSTTRQKTEATTEKQKAARRPVTPKVEFIQVQDTVVKAVIHRNNQ